MKKDLTIVTGNRAVGKTYNMVKSCVKNAINGNKVCIIGQTPHFIFYVRDIISIEFPELKIITLSDGILLIDYDNPIYILNGTNYIEHMNILSEIDTLLIDEWDTLKLLCRNGKFIEKTNNINDIICTISTYHIFKNKIEFVKIVSKFTNRTTKMFKVVGYEE